MYSADQNVKSSLTHLSSYFCSRSFFPGLATKLLHRSMLSRFSQYLYNYSLTLRMWDADSIQNHLKVRRTHLSYHVTAPRLAWAWPGRLVPAFSATQTFRLFPKAHHWFWHPSFRFQWIWCHDYEALLWDLLSRVLSDPWFPDTSSMSKVRCGVQTALPRSPRVFIS